MYSAKAVAVGIAVCCLMLMAVADASAQAYFYRWDNGSGNNNWGTGQNWGPNPPLNLGSNNFTPSAFYEEMGLIDNGNTVNLTTSQTQYNGSAADNVVAAAGVTVDGSTLNIANGGTLSLLATYGTGITPPGPPGAVPTADTGNANINNLGVIRVQPGGTLSVKRSLTINSGSLTVGGVAAGGTVTTGGLNALTTTSAVNLQGSATVNVANGSVLNGTTTITGPNVVFNTPSMSMSASSVFSPIITSAAVPAGTGHSVINVAGGVTLGGTLRPQFQNGVVPQLGNVWTLWDSAQVQGDIAVSDTSGPGAALPTGLRYAITTTTVGSVRGVKGQLTVENFLTAEVNRANGEVTIRNTNTTTGAGVTITGYQIASPGGALKPTGFSAPFGGSWESAGTTANSISELNSTASSNVGLGSSASVGSIYDPVALQTIFGPAPVSDLTLSYTRSDGRTVNAPVTYVNTGLANSLVLQVDPADGKARIINDSIFNNIEIDGYQITSASNSLLGTWSSLEDQGKAGWEKASTVTGFLAELNPNSSTSIDAGEVAATMAGLFQTAGTQDLQFTFRVKPNAGDYNGDSKIDAADYTVWRDNLNSITALAADGDGSGVVDAADYALWKENFGKIDGASLFNAGILNGVVRYEAFSLGAGSGAVGSAQVPEPSGLALVAMLIGRLLLTRRFEGFAARQLC